MANEHNQQSTVEEIIENLQSAEEISQFSGHIKGCVEAANELKESLQSIKSVAPEDSDLDKVVSQFPATAVRKCVARFEK